MPIYEYLCADCNRIYSFLQRGEARAGGPSCPRCGATELSKQVSRFAFKKRAGEDGTGTSGAKAEAGPDMLDDPRIEREMMRLARDAESMDENDPRQMARLMRRMSQVTGEPFDEGMEEAVRRLEAGEDPDRIEEDLGEALDEGLSGLGPSHPAAPIRDEGLYSF